MSIFGRRMSPELLAAELMRGIESGEIVFDGDARRTPPAERADVLIADRVAKVVEEALAPVKAHFQALAAHAADVLKRAEETRQRAEIEAAATLEQARSVLAEAIKTAERVDGGEGRTFVSVGAAYPDKDKASVYPGKDKESVGKWGG